MKRLPRLTKTLLFAGAAALAMGATAYAADDPLLSKQWQWSQTDVTDAWDDGYTGSGVVVGVVSSWVDFSHPDLEGNFSFDFSYDFVGGSAITASTDADSYTSEGRGTFIAGLIAAANNGVGVTGVAYGALIAGLHVGTDNSYSSSNVYDALIYDDGINYTTGDWEEDAIIRVKDCDFTMSGGAYTGSLSDVTGSLSSLSLGTVISEATRNNVIFVTGSGTSRQSTDGSANSNSSYWTSCEDLIVVASTDKEGYYTSTSSYGSNLFVSAPGSSDVYSTRRENSSSTSSTTDDGDGGDEDEGDGSLYGTGYSDSASAIVSGAIALAAANNATMDARWAKWALAYTSTVTDAMRESPDWEKNSAGLSFSNDYGFGMINVDDFVEFSTNIAYETIQESFTGTVGRYSSTIVAGGTETITISTTTAPTDITGETTERLTQCVESVELYVNISGIDYINDLKITIVSSAGTESVVLDTSKMTEEEIGEIWDGSDLNWTFTSNAFWGTQDTGEWQVVIENNGETVGTIEDISLTFNQGSIAMESGDLVIIHGEDSKNVDIHGMCIDHSSTSVTIDSDTVLRVEDSIVMNNGVLIVNGNIDTYDSDWKGVKIYVQGGSVVVNDGGMVTTSDRGVDVYSGSLSVNAGGWVGGTGAIYLYGGSVNLRGEDEEYAAHFVSIEMYGGTLNTSGYTTGTTVTVHGGTFNMSGTNSFSTTTDGGTVLVQGTASINRLTIGSTETRSGYLYVASGATLSVSDALAFSGTYVPAEYETVVEIHKEPVLDIYGNPTYDDDGNPIMEEVSEEHDELVHGEYISYAYGDIRGTIDGAVSLDYASVTITGATFTQNLNVNRGSILFVEGNVSIGTTLRVSGTASETDLDQAIVVAGDGSVITAGSVTVGGNGVFYIGGTGIGTTTILGNESTGIYDTVFSVTAGGTLEVTVGDMLYTNRNVSLNNATISLSFHDILPTDEITFIEFTEDASPTAYVDVQGDCVVVFSDMSEVPQVWDGTQGVDLSYMVREDGVLESDCGVEIVPVRLMYSSFTTEQKAVASAMRSLLPEGAHAADEGSKNKALLDAINSITTLSGLKKAYDQFLPTNLITINDIHNKQAETITNTIERRAREVRNGAPVSDLWSVPLIGRAGFSFSADPNLIASSGFRQFARYEYDANWMAWANGGYSFSNVDATKHTDKTKNEMRNASIGIDFAIVEDCSVGIFATYLDGDVEQKQSKSKTDAALRGVGAYITGSRNNDQGSLYWTGMLSYGFVDYDFKRKVYIGDFSSSATSSPDGRQFIGYISLGYEWDAGSHALSYQWTTGPNVSLRYAHNEVDGYREDSDTSINALKVDDFDYDSLVSSVGWRATVRFDIDEVMTIVPEARIAWQHEFLDSTEKVDVSSFALTGSDGFSTAMNRAGTDYMTVGVGFTVLAMEFLTVSFDYDVNAFREDSGVEHSFNLMVRARF